MIGLLLVTTALAAEVEVGVSTRYSSMIDNLVGITLVNERRSLRPAGGQIYGEQCGTAMCNGLALELFPIGGHASLAAATVGRLIELGPVTAKPMVGLGMAYYGRRSLVPVIAGKNASVLIRVGGSVRWDLPGTFRPVLNVSWDTHPTLPAFTLRRAHDLRVGLGVAGVFSGRG